MTAQIIPFKVPPVNKRVCSFCHRHESSVKHMFSNEMRDNEQRCICNECVVECNNRLLLAKMNLNLVDTNRLS